MIIVLNILGSLAGTSVLASASNQLLPCPVLLSRRHVWLLCCVLLRVAMQMAKQQQQPGGIEDSY